MDKTEKGRYIRYIKSVLPCLALSALVGAVTGIVVFFFKLGAEFLYEKSAEIYVFMRENPAYIPLLFAGLAVIGLAMGFFIKFSPDSAGGGIPRAEGIIRGLLTFKWLKTLISTVIGSYLTFLSGLPLGTEGPSVLIGTSTAGGANKLIKIGKDKKDIIFSAGASAGFAVATGAPLSAIVFAIEEAFQKYSFFILLSAGISVVSAAAVSSALAEVFNFNLSILQLGAIAVPPIKMLWLPAVIGVFCGLLAAAFNSLVRGGVFLFGSLKISPYIKLLSVLFLTGVLGLFFTGALGGGKELITSIADGKYALAALLILFAVKTVLVVFSASSGATGGMFLPLLAIGALIGGISGRLYILAGGDPEFYKIIVAFSVCAFMGASIKAPMTASVFLLEALGSFSGGLFGVTAAFAAAVVVTLLKVESLNDATLERLIRKQAQI